MDMSSGGGRFSAIPSPALVVANGGTGEVTIVDPTTLSVVSSVRVMSGMRPHHIAVSADRTRVLVTATSTDLSGGHGGHAGAGASTMVYQLDVASRELREVISVDATAHNATFTPDGSTIVVGMMEHGMLAGYDATTFDEVFTATGFEMPLEVTPVASGSLLVAESGAGRVARFDLDSRSVTTRFDVGAGPVAAWASGSEYFVSAEQAQEVRHISASGGSVNLDAHVITPGGIPGQAVLDPSRTELWIAVEDAGEVAIFDAVTHAPLGRIATGRKPHGVAFASDGARAFVTDETDGNVVVVDVATRTVSSTISVGGAPNGIVWLEP